jgi:hypothetical protein
MTTDITFFGTVVTIVASTTFPVGFQVTQFADDADPLDFAAVQIGDTAMGVNGDLIAWARAVSLPMVLNVIPGSQDDVNLSLLANLNRVGKGKASPYDLITATVIYPDGTQVTLTGGKLVSAPFGKSGSSNGRLKTRSYSFAFEANIGS